MKFRTEIEPRPLGVQIGYGSRLLALGSCFADAIGTRLAQARFRCLANPAGELFNPASVAAALHSFAAAEPVRAGELDEAGGLWFHYGFHGSFSAPSPGEALTRMNAARQAGARALRDADCVIVTLGTAWVFERDGRVVANCHRRPASEFVRRRMEPDQIVALFDDLMAGPLAGREVILTVSPVRHLADGLEGNAVSKAVLRLAADAVCRRHPAVHYFPAYEILLDDLRDYRFYADDLAHPSPRAVEYLWERFAEAALTPEARRLLPEVESIVEAARHRPLHPGSEAHKAFCRRQLERIAALPGVDFEGERALFERSLQINS